MFTYHAPRRGTKIRPSASSKIRRPTSTTSLIRERLALGLDALSGGAYPQGRCRLSIYACTMRVATLQEDGDPSGFVYVTDQLIKLTIDPQYETGTESNVKNACGTLLGTAKSPDEFKRINLTLELVTPDPELYQMITNGTLLTSGGTTRGFKMPAVGSIVNDGVSIEVWQNAWVGDAQDSDFPLWRWVLPRTNNWKLGSRDLDENFTANILTGEGIENERFFDGPGNDLVSGEHNTALSWILDDVAPATTCGRSVLTGS